MGGQGLGTAAPARRNPASPDPRAERKARWAVRALALAGLLFFGIGAYAWRAERHRLATYRPVPAVVLGTDVLTVSHSGDDDAPTYRPVVRYRYAIPGRGIVVADRVTPLGESRSGGWARAVVAHYRPGMAVTAYVDPEHASRAFLERRRSPLPWAFMGFATVVLAIVGLASGLVRRR